MSRKIITNDIQVLIEMIREQSAIISRYEGKIPQIEIDIVMSNLRRLYEDYDELSKVNRNFRTESGTPPADEPVERELVKRIEEEKPAIEQSQPQPPVGQEEKPPLRQIHLQEKHRETPLKKSREKSSTDLFTDTESLTLADKYKDQKQSTHDKLQDTPQEKTLADTIQNPIQDLRTGIGVNDRFLLINELFKGVMGDYDAVIGDLNLRIGLDDALKRLQELKSVFDWPEDSAALQKLEGFLRRRFI